MPELESSTAETVAELRRFYRLNREPKMRHIERVAMFGRPADPPVAEAMRALAYVVGAAIDKAFRDEGPLRAVAMLHGAALPPFCHRPHVRGFRVAVERERCLAAGHRQVDIHQDARIQQGAVQVAARAGNGVRAGIP